MNQPRTTLSNVARAVGAWAALAALVAAIPAILVTKVGWPLPHTVPTVHQLTSPPTGRFVLDVLAVAGWVIWAWFMAVLASETNGALRCRGTSARVAPRGVHRLAAQLVASAFVLLGPAAAVASAAPASTVPASATTLLAAANPTAAMPISYGSSPSLTAQETVAASTMPGVPIGVHYVVVTEGDTLWGLAHTHLGDGLAYSQIWDLNANKAMSTGETFADPNLIRPGWVLLMPSASTATQIAAATPPAAPVPAPPVPATPGPAPSAVTAPAAPAAPNAHSSPAAAPTSQAPPARLSPPAAAVPTARPLPAVPPPAHIPVPEGEHRAGPVVPLPVELIGAPILAFGLVAFIAKLTKVQQGRRRRGRSVPRPTGEQARVELAARVAADPAAADLVDVGLRYLASGLHDHPVPPILGVEVHPDRLVVLLDQPPGHTPAGFTLGADELSWELAADVADRVADDVDEIVPPLPALVTLGHDGPITVMANLGAVGVVALGGDPQAARETVAAAAVELATASWSQQAQILLVGFGHDEGLGRPEPVQLVDNLDDCLERLRRSAAAMRQLAGETQAGSLDELRLSGDDPVDLGPTIVICLDPPAPDVAAELAGLASDPTSGLNAVIASGHTSAGWNLEIDADGNLEVEPLGRRITSQRIPLPLLDVIEGRIAVAGATADTDPAVAVEDWWPQDVDSGDVLHEDDTHEDDVHDDGIVDDVVNDDLEVGTPTWSAPPSDPAETAEPSAAEHPATRGQAADHRVPEAPSDDLGLPAPRLRSVTSEETPAVLGPGFTTIPVEAWREGVQPEILVQILQPTPCVTRLAPSAGPVTVGRHRSLELIAYLACHEEGVSRTRLAEVIHPEVVAAGRAHNTNTYSVELSTARTSLGESTAGVEHMPQKSGERFRLGPTVAVDATIIERLLAAAEQADNDNDRIRLLGAAFALVADSPPLADVLNTNEARRRRGPKSDRPAQHWQWFALEVAPSAVETIVDVAGGLSELYLVTGDVKAASAVARKGLAISPLNKSLWMTYLTVEAERDVHHLQLAKDWMDRTFASEAEPYDTVDAELQQLTAELLARKSS
ncbi:MAG: LysM peptidoglycan-binding domain-containing protein [Actinomycetota bacterium]|nr:LysM peptidoglycan-binding domain-containing protein [Actinomycetota bacterium]